MKSFFKGIKWNHSKLSLILNLLFFSLFMISFLGLILFNHAWVRLTGYGVYRVSSDSMEPVLNVSDFILVKQSKLSDLESGDIIVFETRYQQTSVPITERVVVIHYFAYEENQQIYTYSEMNKTDAGFILDEWGTTSSPYVVTETDLIGSYIRTFQMGPWLMGILSIGLSLIVYRYYAVKQSHV